MAKDINWAVREICKAYGCAPRSGKEELADILRELIESNDSIEERNHNEAMKGAFGPHGQG